MILIHALLGVCSRPICLGRKSGGISTNEAAQAGHQKLLSTAMLLGLQALLATVSRTGGGHFRDCVTTSSEMGGGPMDVEGSWEQKERGLEPGSTRCLPHIKWVASPALFPNGWESDPIRAKPTSDAMSEQPLSPTHAGDQILVGSILRRACI